MQTKYKAGLATLAVIVTVTGGLLTVSHFDTRHKRDQAIADNLPKIVSLTAEAAARLQSRADQFVGRYDQRAELLSAADYMKQVADAAAKLPTDQDAFLEPFQSMNRNFSTSYSIVGRVNSDLRYTYERAISEAVALCEIETADSFSFKVLAGDHEALIAADALFADAIANVQDLADRYAEEAKSGSGLEAVASGQRAVRINSMISRAQSGRRALQKPLQEVTVMSTDVAVDTARANNIARAVGVCRYKSAETQALGAAAAVSRNDFATAALLYELAANDMDEVVTAGSDSADQLKVWQVRAASLRSKVADAEGRAESSTIGDIFNLVGTVTGAFH